MRRTHITYVLFAAAVFTCMHGLELEALHHYTHLKCVTVRL